MRGCVGVGGHRGAKGRNKEKETKGKKKKKSANSTDDRTLIGVSCSTVHMYVLCVPKTSLEGST